MLIIKVIRGDIEKSLKELKKKVIKTGQQSLLNEKKEYKKKSVYKREVYNKAVFKSKINKL